MTVSDEMYRRLRERSLKYASKLGTLEGLTVAVLSYVDAGIEIPAQLKDKLRAAVARDL